jgi:hypothetical protein
MALLPFSYMGSRHFDGREMYVVGGYVETFREQDRVANWLCKPFFDHGV